jgi:hypothetical protein
MNGLRKTHVGGRRGFQPSHKVIGIQSALQAAEKLNGRGTKCQGTTSVVPQMPQNKCGLQPLRDVLFQFHSKSGVFPQPVKRSTRTKPLRQLINSTYLSRCGRFFLQTSIFIPSKEFSRLLQIDNRTSLSKVKKYRPKKLFFPSTHLLPRNKFRQHQID